VMPSMPSSAALPGSKGPGNTSGSQGPFGFHLNDTGTGSTG
jgi:hypothetical protein